MFKLSHVMLMSYTRIPYMSVYPNIQALILTLMQVHQLASER